MPLLSERIVRCPRLDKNPIKTQFCVTREIYIPRTSSFTKPCRLLGKKWSNNQSIAISTVFELKKPLELKQAGSHLSGLTVYHHLNAQNYSPPFDINLH
jgi:hypothetical protein